MRMEHVLRYRLLGRLVTYVRTPAIGDNDHYVGTEHLLRIGHDRRHPRLTIRLTTRNRKRWL